MVYLFTLFFFYQYLRIEGKHHSSLEKENTMRDAIWLIPIVAMWCFVIGGQYKVGTDYLSYLLIFSGQNVGYLLDKGDWGFVNFVSLCNSIGLYGQDIFMLIAFVWILILLYVARSAINDRYLFLFFLIFVVFPSTFNNQMNGIRQYCAVYLYSLGMVLVLRSKWIIGCIILAAMTVVHSSSIVALILTPLLIIVGRDLEKRRYLLAALLVALIFSFAFPEEWITPIISHFDQYAYYAEDGRIEVGGISILNKITKYIYVPLVIYSIYLLPYMRLNQRQHSLFVIGILGYCFKIALLDITLMNRMGAYFEILMCIPMTYMLIYHLSYRRTLFPFLILYLFLPYAVKVTLFAENEYTYHSIFFT